MQVSHLFSPQHAARAAQVLKSRNWSQLEFLNLLMSIRSHGPISKLTPLAKNMLYAYLPMVNNPMIRHECLSILDYEKLPVAEKHEFASNLCESFLNSEETESACSLESQNLKVDVLEKLINLGATNLTPTSEATWSKELELCLRNQDLKRVKTLWNARPTNPAFWISEPNALGLVELAGKSQDTELLESVLLGTRRELPLTSGTVAASLECFLSKPFELLRVIEELESLVAETVTITDLRIVAETLVSFTVIMQILQKPSISPMIGNLVLLGLYRKQTSQTVFHVFRFLVTQRKFVPNATTAQILANSAYRLGNSKLLMYEIWREMVLENRLTLDRKFYETAVMCQLVGSRFDSVQFFLAEMSRRQVPIRAHIQQLIYNKLERQGNTSLMMEILTPNLKARHTQFSHEEAASESPMSQQARANAQLFIDGKSPEEEPLAVLSGMLDFDSRRAAKYAEAP